MLLDDIKKEFEIIPSIQVYEKYSDEEKIYNTTLRFYTNKEYKEICDIVELFYIAIILSDRDYNNGVFNSLKGSAEYLLSNIICDEGMESKKLNIEEIFRLNQINISLLIGSRTEYYKNNGKKIFFQDRCAWEIKEVEGNRYYYRRRLYLYIAPNDVKHILIRKETLCQT